MPELEGAGLAAAYVCPNPQPPSPEGGLRLALVQSIVRSEIPRRKVLLGLFFLLYLRAMIKNIVFDFGGVLVDWDRHYFFDTYFESPAAREIFEHNTGIKAMSPLEMSNWFLDNICTLEWNAQMDGGKALEQGTQERVDEFPEWEQPIRAYFANWTTMLRGAVDGMYEIVERLKQEGYHLYGLSNWSAITFDAYVGDNYPVFRFLEGKVISGREKCIKPGDKIYRILLDRYDLVPSETIFIDDSLPNLEAARKFGIKTYHFRGAKQLEEDLKSILQ